MGLRAALFAMPLAIALAGCELPDTAVVPLAYEPTGSAPVFQTHPAVAVGTVIDGRVEVADRIGTATGQLGFPELTLTAEPAVRRAVRGALTDALMARGLLAPPPARPRFVLSVRIVRLDAAEGWKRRAAADLVFTLTRSDTGRIVWSGEARSEGTGRGPYSLDTLAYVPVADVAEMAQGTMNSAIERLLDDAGFKAALRG